MVTSKQKPRSRPAKKRPVPPNRQAREAASAAAARRRGRRNRVVVAGFLAIVLIGGIAILVGGGGTTTVSTGPTTTAAPTPVSLPKPPDGATITGDTPCPKPDGTSPRTLHFAKPPPSCISPARTYTADIRTSMGTITVALDPKDAPTAVNNFVVLARYHYFDGIAFHRIIPGFVIQGGDPLETGLGSPGYKFDDELPKGAAASYKVGSLAMANSGPNTNGSQFFIVSGDTGAQLQALYSLFGQATPESLDVIKKIDAAGSADQSGAPTAVVTIESVTIKES
ncbi:MAG: peptidylprolyl isomerase [Acidimicrobiales bacterium]